MLFFIVLFVFLLIHETGVVKKEGVISLDIANLLEKVSKTKCVTAVMQYSLPRAGS